MWEVATVVHHLLELTEIGPKPRMIDETLSHERMSQILHSLMSDGTNGEILAECLAGWYESLQKIAETPSSQTSHSDTNVEGLAEILPYKKSVVMK